MFIGYLDESARDDRYYFVGTLLVDEASLVRIEEGLNRIARMIATDVPGFDVRSEFHGYDMFHGEKGWTSVPLGWRVKACKLVAKVIAGSGARYMFRGINIAAQRARYPRPYPPHALCVAHSFATVDEFLEKDNHAEAKAIMLADDHHSAPDSRRNLRSFKVSAVRGYTDRPCVRIADTIYFGPSDESRLLQACDVATYFLNRYRTITETDPRATAAVERIVAYVRSVTRFEYVWNP